MGLRPAFRDMGRRLAGEGYVVLVPNPFYRSKKAPVIEGKIDFSNPAQRELLTGYRKAMTDVPGDAAAYLPNLPFAWWAYRFQVSGCSRLIRITSRHIAAACAASPASMYTLTIARRRNCASFENSGTAARPCCCQ